MMKSVHELLLVLLALFLSPDLPAQPFECRPYRIAGSAENVETDRFSKGLLWQVSRDGRVSGYVFGTIHVDDPDILDLPAPVSNSFNMSRHYVMELVPAADDMQKFADAMFFQDGSRLDALLPAELYARTVSILLDYGMTGEVVSLLKPWAAFVLMSYPDNMDMVLDMQLLELAHQNNAEVSGLETIDEQIAIFSGMDLDDQVRILTDTVCHYENTDADFEVMKSLYLERDLQGLVSYSHRYQFEDNSVYDDAYDRLIDQRNRRMVERMEVILAERGAFIAVGAMHLPGENGILSLLENRKYTITRVY